MQTRSDRDNYVAVLVDNIVPGHEREFAKRSFTEDEILKVPYDTESLLHLPRYAYSTDPDNLDTMQSKADPSAPLGNMVGPTPSDYQKVMNFYCNGDTYVPGMYAAPTKPIMPHSPTSPPSSSKNTEK